MAARAEIPPRRIVIVGTTGAGKSAFARRLGEALDLAIAELDELHWLPGWRKRPEAEFHGAVAAAAAAPAWIVVGNYRASWDLTWPRAELVIWLDYSFARTAVQLVARSIRRAWTRMPVCNGNVESWRNLFSRDSILVWLLRTFRRNRRRYGALLADSSAWPQLRVLRLAHPREADALLERWRANAVRLRPATSADAPLLRRWDDEPHVVESDPNDDWNWEVELGRWVDWREQLIAEVGGVPVGFIQIIDPAREESRYWGDVPPDLRAVDIWIGEAAYLDRGFGTRMMELALERCFADPDVTAVLVDPLASNARAIRFYRRLGFRPLERRRFGADDCLVHRLERSAWQARDRTWTSARPVPRFGAGGRG